MPLARAAASGDEEDHCHVGGKAFCLNGMPTAQSKLSSFKPWRNAALKPYRHRRVRSRSVRRVRESGRSRPARFRAWSCRHAGTIEPCGITRPALRQEQPQPYHVRHFATGQRQRYERPAVGVLAKRRGILRRDADRVASLLGQRGVVDDQPGIVPANLSVGLGEQRRFQRRGIPDAARNEMVQLVVAGRP